MLADRLPITVAVLRARWRSLLIWTLAVAAIAAIYSGFYSALGDPGQWETMLEGMPEELTIALGYDQIGSPAGYLESTVFGLLGPILLLVFGISTGARLIAGEEEDGSLELELAHPVSRTRVLAERALALVLSLLLLTAAVELTVMGMVALQGMDVALANVAATATGMWLLVLGFSTLALGVGAATGRRAAALGVAAGLAVLTFVADAVAPLVDWGGALEAVSPFTWYLGGEPLAQGWDPGGLLALAAVSAVALMVGLIVLPRRDTGV